MGDFGLGVLGMGAGAQQGLDTLLKRRLLERQMALAEQAQRENADYRNRSLADSEGWRKLQWQQREDQNAAMAADRDADNQRQAAQQRIDLAGKLAASYPKGAPVGDAQAGLFRATGMGHLAQPKEMPMPESATDMPGDTFMGAEFAGLPEKQATPSSSVVKTRGPNGKPIYTPTDQAAGMEAWDDPGQGPRPYFTFPTGMGADGKPVVYRGDARTGELTPTVGPGGNPIQPRLTGTEQTKVNSLAEARQALQILRQVYAKPGMRDAVGPVAGRFNSVKTGLPESMADLPPGFTELVPAVANYRNRVITAITGAQMGEKEADRIRQQTPELFDRGDVFDSKLKMSEQLMEYAYQRWNRADEYRAQGIDGKQLEKILDTEFGVASAPTAGKVYLDPNGNPIKR